MAGRYEKEKLKEISFPLGGIGTGSVGLAGNGRFVDWQIANRPNVHSVNGFTHLAVKAQRGDTVVDARVLQGDFAPPYSGGETSGLRGNNGFGQGPDRCTMAGVPHFQDVVFEGEFPLASLKFSQSTFPGEVRLDAMNPFIPSNSADSSLPAAFFTVTLHNPTQDELDYTVCFSLNNMAAPTAENRRELIGGYEGIFLGQLGEDKDSPNYGNLALVCMEPDVSFQENWFRGAWFDSLTVFWKEFTAPGRLKNRRYEEASQTKFIDRMRGEDMCSLAAHVRLAPGERRAVRFVMAWSFPNYQNDWNPIPDSDPIRDNTWKNYYATVFEDSRATAVYCLQEWERLERDTRAFHRALSSSTLPEKALEAVSNTLSVLHSPTCLRLADGTFWAWEGCNPFDGSCEGSCTHVWNYNYALPLLFPDLERSMHDAHFRYDMRPSGSLAFRTMLPLGREPWEMRACADGQFGDIINVYREYKLSGDREWLERTFPAVKKALSFAWSPDNEDRWDPNASGVLTGRQHHTLDMELFGPSSWLNGMYLAALKAASRMAHELGETQLEQQYQAVFESGSAWVEEHLFNGEYYQQEVDLTDYEHLSSFGEDAVASYWNAEAGQMKYQIGEGCSIDQLLGQWHANLCGLGDIFSPEHRKTALQNLFQNNFKEHFRDFFNGCRNYALNDEGGLVICTWGEGKEVPVIPITYSDEVMTGFEYAAASLMIAEGLEEQGLRCVEKVRERYDGEKRNPFNEIECGSYYARAMAAWALLLTYSGFSCDLAAGKLGFAPLHPQEEFSFFFSVDGAWGTFSRKDGGLMLSVLYGKLSLEALEIPFVSDVKSVRCGSGQLPFEYRDGVLYVKTHLSAGNTLQIC